LAGRKTSLTVETGDQIAKMLQTGVPLAVALAATGTARRTYFGWIARPEPLYVAFRERIEQARAIGEATLIATIARTARTDWRASAFLLERSAPERWARVSQRTGEEPPQVDPFEEFAKPDELAARRKPS
jgi:hypothetical protein